MRPFYALAIAIVMLGGTYAYTQFCNRIRVLPAEYQAQFDQADYSVEIRRSFDVSAHPIFSPDSITVKFKGVVVYSSTANLPANELIIVQQLNDVEVGENELLVTANRANTDSSLAALVVEVKQNDVVIAKQVITSETGLSTVRGTVLFATASRDTNEHAH